MNIIHEYFNWVIVRLFGAEEMTKYNYALALVLSIMVFILLVYLACWLYVNLRNDVSSRLASGLVSWFRHISFLNCFYYINLQLLGYCGHVFVNRITRRAIWWNGGVSKKIKNPEKLDCQTIEFMDARIEINFLRLCPVVVHKKEVNDD